MSLSPKDQRQITYGSYNVYGNDMVLETAPVQKSDPAPKSLAKERLNEPSKKEADRNELLKLYYERDKEFEAAKGKRTLLTFLFFVVSYYVLLCAAFSWPTDLKSALALFLPVSFFAAIHYLINRTIFGYLYAKGSEENEILERIRNRIQDLDK